MTPPDDSCFRNELCPEQRTTRRLLAIIEELRTSTETGQARELERVLHPGVTLLVDGGGRVPAPIAAIRDRTAVARTLLGLFGPTTGSIATVVSANGVPALAFARDGRVIAILTARAKRGRAADVWVVANPDKLQRWNGA